MGFSKPLIGGVADIGNFLVHAIFLVLLAIRRLRGSLQVIGKRVAACSIEQRLQMCVATNAGSEAVAIGLPQCIDAGVASLLTTAILDARSLTLSSLVFFASSGSFFWHGTPISDASEPELYNQPQIGLHPSTAVGRLPIRSGQAALVSVALSSRLAAANASAC
jgi:hypothetical protein